MTEETTGIKYSITVDDSALREAAGRVTQEFDDIATQAQASGKKIDTLFDGAAKSAASAVGRAPRGRVD